MLDRKKIVILGAGCIGLNDPASVGMSGATNIAVVDVLKTAGNG